MKTELMNLFLFIGICLVVYLLFRNFNYNNQYSLIEGMTDASTTGATPTATASTNNGIAGNSPTYGAQIKAATIKLQDTFLISKLFKYLFPPFNIRCSIPSTSILI